MEDLQSTLQSILSDPEQMNRVAALAESLGLKPPERGPARPLSAGSEPSGESAPTSIPSHAAHREGPATSPFEAAPNPLGGIDLSRLMAQLSAMTGTEDRVMGALRPSLSPEGQKKADRALRAAKLSRLAGLFLSRRRESHV